MTARTRAGTVTFQAIQGYDDGESVRWDANLTVLPASGTAAPSQRFDRALAAGAVGLVVIAGSFLVLRLAQAAPTSGSIAAVGWYRRAPCSSPRS